MPDPHQSMPVRCGHLDCYEEDRLLLKIGVESRFSFKPFPHLMKLILTIIDPIHFNRPEP